MAHASETTHVPGESIIERKQKPDGSIREYGCTLVHRRGGLTIVRFDMPNGGTAFQTPVAFPPGSWSYGFFWLRRPFNLYRMRSPNGTIAAHRFDAVCDVRFGPGEVCYRDLALDWWALPGDILSEEDRDEFDALCASGVLSAADAEAANQAARQVYSRYRHIIDDVAALERRLNLPT